MKFVPNASSITIETSGGSFSVECVPAASRSIIVMTTSGPNGGAPAYTIEEAEALRAKLDQAIRVARAHRRPSE